ncbi:MAG: Asp-tRNA(Asn)/Glu-tRNA(Gln) amidotransferase subunit GatC [Nitrospinota bacterium]
MVTVKEAEAVARLARLELKEDEKGEIAEKLSDVLDNIKHLNKLDTENVGFVLTSGQGRDDLRVDEDRPVASHGDLMENAPEKENGHFRVPKVLD